MNELIKKRLEDLKTEKMKGTQLLAERQKQMDDLKLTLMRIEGAIEVLEEMLQSAQDQSTSDSSK